MQLRKFLILSHRYLGIPLGLLFVVWFATGIVMMYAGGMPQLSAEQRLERLPTLDLSAVRLTPAEAAKRAGVDRTPETAALVSVTGRPAYRFGRPPDLATIFADTGDVLRPLDIEESRAIAARFAGVPADAVRYVATVTEPDQWTLTQARNLPLHKFEIEDDAGTEVYVSPLLAEVTLLTTSNSRMLAWIGTIPHWFYFTPLRVNQPLWYWSVVVASGLGCVLAVMGLALGVTQIRPTKPFRLSASIRYRGWMRWHYILGVVFGIFTLTWVFSGLLSMEPFAWTAATGLEIRDDALGGGPVELARFPAVDRSAWDDLLGELVPKEIELTRIQDEPYYVARYAAGPEPAPPEPKHGKRERLHQPYGVTLRGDPGFLLVAAETMQARTGAFSVASVLERLRDAVPDAAIIEHELLSEYDSYYYSRGRQAPLPVLRVKFDDPLETWVYVDPQMSRIVAQIHRLNRLERWLYNGLHSLDFGFWYDKRPLWDIGMILLSLGALVASCIGLVFGINRVRRAAARALGG